MPLRLSVLSRPLQVDLDELNSGEALVHGKPSSASLDERVGSFLMLIATFYDKTADEQAYSSSLIAGLFAQMALGAILITCQTSKTKSFHRPFSQ
jgi:hypothetical protein